MSAYDDIINRAAHTIMVESWGVTEEHPEGVGGFGSPPVELVQAPIRDVLAAELLRLKAEWYRHGLHDTTETGVKELRILVRSFGAVLLGEGR